MKLSFSLLVWFVLGSVLTFCASSLKCNSCSSSTSFEDCVKQETTVHHCDEDYKCGKTHFKYKGKDIYTLSCVRNMHCDNSSYMCGPNVKMTNCEVTCCDQDLCNTAATLVVSVLVTLACVLRTLFV